MIGPGSDKNTQIQIHRYHGIKVHKCEAKKAQRECREQPAGNSFQEHKANVGEHCSRTLTHSSTLKNAKYDQTNTQLQIHIQNWYEITEMFDI